MSPRSMTSNFPPSAITRSRIPISPNPLPSAGTPLSAALPPSSSIVSASQRRCAAVCSPASWTEAESDAGLTRIRMLVDVGKALLDDSIDVRRRRRRQDPEVAIDLKRDFQLSAGQPFLIPSQSRKTGGEPEVIDLGRAEGPQRGTERSHHGHRESARDCLPQAREPGTAVSAVALIEAATALMALRLCASSSCRSRAKSSRSCSWLIDELGSELRSFRELSGRGSPRAC